MELTTLTKGYEAGASTEALATDFGVSSGTIAKYLKEAGVQLRSPGFRKGKNHHGWAGGIQLDDNGYIRVWVPADSPLVSMAQQHGKCAGGYALEHRIVLAQKLGRPLSAHETVHHIDGDRQNNTPDNLQLRQGKHGTGASYCCADCGSHNVVSMELVS